MDAQAYDVIVVGAGLSGLSAGLHLQGAGGQVVILEKNATPGGLCSTAHLDGFEFAIGCNDFGRALVRKVSALGVPISFQRSRVALFYDRRDGALQRYTLPPDASTLLRLFGWAPEI